jgi:glycosyltransferase involved in cell wall biosynthesis
MISDQHLIPHGGIGQFCRSFANMVESMGHRFVLITDKKPRNKFAEEVSSGWKFYPKEPHSYEKHRQIYGRFKEGPNHEKVLNFRNSLINSELLFDFDLIVANSHESIAALADYQTKSKKVLYTHLYKQIYPSVKFTDVFLPSYHSFFQQFLYRNDVVVGTQSHFNKCQLESQNIKNVEILPMPITETKLLENSDNLYKNGILFVGRWEKGKNPTDYIKMIKEFELPAKVLTNINGGKKFRECFEKENIKDYDIREGIIGQEKVDFIKSCKVFLNTSLIECFPNSVVETIGHMPIIVLDKVKVPWHDNFPRDLIYQSSVKKMNDVLPELYYNQTINNSDGLKFVNNLHKDSYEKWANFIEKA